MLCVEWTDLMCGSSSIVCTAVCDEGAGENYLEKSLGRVSAWLLDAHSAEAWNKGLYF